MNYGIENKRDVLNHIEAMNSVSAWEFAGWIYISTPKPFSTMKNFVSVIGCTDIEIVHRVEDTEENFLILCGEAGTGLTFAGRECPCHVYRCKHPLQ